jgi:hypothetical protein
VRAVLGWMSGDHDGREFVLEWVLCLSSFLSMMSEVGIFHRWFFFTSFVSARWMKNTEIHV